MLIWTGEREALYSCWKCFFRQRTRAGMDVVGCTSGATGSGVTGAQAEKGLRGIVCKH